MSNWSHWARQPGNRGLWCRAGEPLQVGDPVEIVNHSQMTVLRCAPLNSFGIVLDVQANPLQWNGERVCSRVFVAYQGVIALDVDVARRLLADQREQVIEHPETLNLTEPQIDKLLRACGYEPIDEAGDPIPPAEPPWTAEQERRRQEEDDGA